MEALSELLDNDNIDVAIPDNRGHQQYDKIDKGALKWQLNTKKDLSEIQNMLKDHTFDEWLEWMENKKREGDALYGERRFEDALHIYL